MSRLVEEFLKEQETSKTMYGFGDPEDSLGLCLYYNKDNAGRMARESDAEFFEYQVFFNEDDVEWVGDENESFELEELIELAREQGSKIIHEPCDSYFDGALSPPDAIVLVPGLAKKIGRATSEEADWYKHIGESSKRRPVRRSLRE